MSGTPVPMRRRRCMALRIAVVLGAVLAVSVRDDPQVLAVVATASFVALVGAVVACRGLRREAGRR